MFGRARHVRELLLLHPNRLAFPHQYSYTRGAPDLAPIGLSRLVGKPNTVATRRR